MNTVIPPAILQSIVEQAEREYPSECCGMILGPKDEPNVLRTLKTCKNVYDVYKALDAQNFPRDSRTAYFIDSAGLLQIQKEARQKNEEIRIIYHSHINTGAYFSEEDTRVALAEGEPAYPGAKYLVLSVIEGKVKDSRLYSWDVKQRKFLA